MDNITDFEYKGIWWFPNDPDKKWHGTLKYSPLDRAKLTIEEYNISQESIDISDKNFPCQPEIILGETIDRKAITLQKCLREKTTWYPPTNKQSSFSVKRIFINWHFENMKDIAFNTMTVSFNNLDEWVNINGFTFCWDKDKDYKVKIEYDPPKKIEIKIDSDLIIEIGFEVEGPSRLTVQKEIDIKQKIVVKFISTKVKKLDCFLKIIKCFQDFFTFATQKASRPIMMKSSGAKDKLDCPSIAIISSSYIIPAFTNKNFLRYSVLVPFTDIFPQNKNIIKNWFEIYETMSSILQLYFSYLYNPKMYVEDHFLSLIHALEGYHRVTYDGCYIDNTEYKKEIYKPLAEAIPVTLKEDLKNALKQRLYYGNEFSLKERLTDLFEEIHKLEIDIKVENGDEFISKIIKTRNSLIHRDKPKKDKSVRGVKLHYLTLRLKFLFDFCLLKSLGFDDNEIKSKLLFMISQYREPEDNIL